MCHPTSEIALVIKQEPTAPLELFTTQRTEVHIAIYSTFISKERNINNGTKRILSELVDSRGQKVHLINWILVPNCLYQNKSLGI